MILMDITHVSLSNMGYVVLLRHSSDPRTLPIFIGELEAHAIAIQLNHVKVPRPLTHDLLKNVLDFLECRLKRIVVSELRDNTFYAKLVLERDGNETEVDSRPSDAVALALRFGAPIYVMEEIMESAGVVLPDDLKKEETSDKKPKSPELSPLETLKQQLENAIKEEKYENAARLRDEIKKLTKSN